MPKAPKPRIHFQRIDNSENYIGFFPGGYSNYDLEDVRITLYDRYKQQIETGLLSEYSRNSSYGYFIGFEDLNANSKIDSPDTFYIYGHGEVLPSWGIVLTYEKTGRILTSSTISGEHFSLKENRKEPDDSLMIRYTVMTLMLFNLLIILAVVYKMPSV
jgi:hypothetical protein